MELEQRSSSSDFFWPCRTCRSCRFFRVGSRCERDGEQMENDVVWFFNTEAQRLGGTEVVLELARGASATGNSRNRPQNFLAV